MKKKLGLLMIAVLIGINLWLWPNLIGKVVSDQRGGEPVAEAGESQADDSALGAFRVVEQEGEFMFQIADEVIPLTLLPDQVEERIGAPKQTIINTAFTPLLDEWTARALHHLHGPLSIHYEGRSGDSYEMTYAANADILEEDWWKGILPEERLLQDYEIAGADGRHTLLIHAEKADSEFIHISLTKTLDE